MSVIRVTGITKHDSCQSNLQWICRVVRLFPHELCTTSLPPSDYRLRCHRLRSLECHCLLSSRVFTRSCFSCHCLHCFRPALPNHCRSSTVVVELNDDPTQVGTHRNQRLLALRRQYSRQRRNRLNVEEARHRSRQHRIVTLVGLTLEHTAWRYQQR